QSFENNQQVFPLVIKPTQGKSSEGLFVVHDEYQFEAVMKLYQILDKPVIIQRYIESDREFTVSLINLGTEIEVLCMERILNKGATQYSKINNDPNVIEIANQVHGVLGKEFILNLQIIQKRDEYYLIEINPR